MKITRYLPVAATCLLVAACASPAHLEAERREREYQQDYGAVPNSPAFTECMNEMYYKRYGTYDRNYTYVPADPYNPPPPPPYRAYPHPHPYPQHNPMYPR